MDESPSDFRVALAELLDGDPPADHPSPDRWLAYHRGELTPEEEAVLQEHLARCRDCFDLSAGAAEFAKPDAEPGANQEVETAAVWRLVRPRPAPAPPARRFRWPTYLAASFFVALVGMNVLYWQQRSELKTLATPQANVASTEFGGGERATGPETSIPAGPRMLVFHPKEDLLAYRLTIRDAATSREWKSYKMLPDQNLNLILYLPEGLPPGRYRLELADGAGKVLEMHAVRVTPGG